MRLPWISREHYDDLMCAKNAHIDALTEQIRSLRAQLVSHVAVTVKLPDDFAVIQPAVVFPSRKKKAQPEGETEPAPKPRKTIDWETVDENDPAQLAEIAAEEMEGVPAHQRAYVLAQTVARIRRHCQMARIQKALRVKEAGETGTISTPSQKMTEEPEHVPEYIQRLQEKG